MTSQSHPKKRSWIFQANPDRYSIQTSLRKEDTELWGTRQFKSEIRAGDTVYIWLSGKEAGIYARGTILSDPAFSRDSPRGIAYWADKKEGLREIPRVRVRYDAVFMERPLYKGFLLWDSVLEGMTILSNPRGTNFQLTEAEAEKIEHWLSRMPS